jgi:hypothetical protein
MAGFLRMGWNKLRYCELFLIGGDAVTKGLQAEFYNSTDPSGGADFAARMRGRES